MPAVSSESPRVSADLSESEPTLRTEQPDGSPGPDPQLNASDFGANQWLVDELYQGYLADPGSVDQAWWSFFSDYRSNGANGDDTAPDAESNGTTTAAPPTANGANGSNGAASATAPAETGQANGTAAPQASAPTPPAPPAPAPDQAQ